MSNFPINVGDIITLTSDSTVNKYKPSERIMPMGSKAKVLAIRRPFPNQGCRYVDVEFINEFNPDGSPTRGGNWHAGSFGEVHGHFKPCPDGSGEMGFVFRKIWRSLDGKWVDAPRGQRDFIHNKKLPFWDKYEPVRWENND